MSRQNKVKFWWAFQAFALLSIVGTPLWLSRDLSTLPGLPSEKLPLGAGSHAGFISSEVLSVQLKPEQLQGDAPIVYTVGSRQFRFKIDEVLEKRTLAGLRRPASIGIQTWSLKQITRLTPTLESVPLLNAGPESQASMAASAYIELVDELSHFQLTFVDREGHERSVKIQVKFKNPQA